MSWDSIGFDSTKVHPKRLHANAPEGIMEGFDPVWILPEDVI